MAYGIIFTVMIEFNGAISEKAQLDRLKRVDKNVMRVFIVGLIIIWLILILSDLIFGNVLRELWKEAVLCTVIMIVPTLLTAKMPEKVALRFKIAPHIIITENDLSLEMYSNGKQVWRTRKISKVKKILDCGEVYYIIFKFGDITNSWVCSKSNIVNGTIDKFETLFQSKIVKTK